jgi:hypothetical protein
VRCLGQIIEEELDSSFGTPLDLGLALRRRGAEATVSALIVLDSVDVDASANEFSGKRHWVGKALLLERGAAALSTGARDGRRRDALDV